MIKTAAAHIVINQSLTDERSIDMDALDKVIADLQDENDNLKEQVTKLQKDLSRLESMINSHILNGNHVSQYDVGYGLK
jgi:peptidoglycan hydrolase CwlO-like protein